MGNIYKTVDKNITDANFKHQYFHKYTLFVNTVCIYNFSILVTQKYVEK